MSDRKPADTDRKMVENLAVGSGNNVTKRRSFAGDEVELEDRKGQQALEMDSARGSFANEIPANVLDDN